MKRTILITIISFTVYLSAQAQKGDSVANVYVNSAESMLAGKGNLNIGGYGEVHFNQPLVNGQKTAGTLDVHRIVMFLGYNFSKKTSFVSEIEFEYAKELWVEQAFLQHNISRSVNLRAGLLLVPMGIINEYHEPTTFNGVERPLIDNKLSLSTWREVGAGISGNILPASLKYQAYIVGGLNGYDTKAVFSGSAGLREGRQKGSKAYLTSPAFTGKAEYYGLRNLNIGLSLYAGKSQSKLYNKLPENDEAASARADSSSTGIMIVGADARYRYRGLELRGQFYYTSLGNTDEYNVFTRSNGKNNDLGNSMLGYYAEAGFNIFSLSERINQELTPFIRYEYLNMHNTVDENMSVNKAYENTALTAGLTWKLHKQAVVKFDVLFLKPADTGKHQTGITNLDDQSPAF